MKITIKLFASLRQTLEQRILHMELPEGATVADLEARLQADYPQLRLGEGTVMLAVNMRYAKPHQILHEDDEVALIPPVSGG